jgi:hypothetical protein
MKAARWNRSALIVCLIAGGIAGNGAGRASAQAVLPPLSEPGQFAVSVGEDNKEHVHIFMINGLTILPHIYGSMNPVGDTLTKQGFVHNQTASHYYRWSFQNKIRCVRQCDPQARIVLVGYSIGAGVVHSMANTLDKEGIPVALMVYLDGHSFVSNFHQRPGNTERIVCITSSSLVLRGIAVPEADCIVEVGNSRHLSVPKKDATLQILLRELNAVAATVPSATPVAQIMPAAVPPAPPAWILSATAPGALIPAPTQAVTQVAYETTPLRYAPPSSRPPICDCRQAASRPILRRLWQSSRTVSGNPPATAEVSRGVSPP